MFRYFSSLIGWGWSLIKKIVTSWRVPTLNNNELSSAVEPEIESPEIDHSEQLTDWVIEPRGEGFRSRINELWSYRRIGWFFAVRMIKRLYQGTVLGKFWLLRPIIPIMIGALIFGALLGVPSDGLPYFLFFLVGSAIWMVFERSCLFLTRSLDMNKGLIKKLYFPRLVVPVASMAPSVVYFIVFAVLIFLTLLYYQFTEGRWYLVRGVGPLISLFALCMAVMLSLGIGLFTAIWQVKAKDVRYTLRYVLRFWGYLTPVIYPLSQVPEEYQGWMLLNPMAGYVETFKWGLLGTGNFESKFLLSSLSITVLLLCAGMLYFHYNEAMSVDKM